MGILAYTLGLRHAFDADHIAAIDNTVRNYCNNAKIHLALVSTSIGHSSVVFLMAVFRGICKMG